MFSPMVPPSVARRPDPVGEGAPVLAGVREVVLGGHVGAVPLGGGLEGGVRPHRATAGLGPLGVDQGQDLRGAALDGGFGDGLGDGFGCGFGDGWGTASGWSGGRRGAGPRLRRRRSRRRAWWSARSVVVVVVGVLVVVLVDEVLTALLPVGPPAARGTPAAGEGHGQGDGTPTVRDRSGSLGARDRSSGRAGRRERHRAVPVTGGSPRRGERGAAAAGATSGPTYAPCASKSSLAATIRPTWASAQSVSTAIGPPSETPSSVSA